MTIYEVFTLLGGVGLFLYGMTLMSSGLRGACGEKLRDILARATTNKPVSVLAGAAVTVLIQSSSATNVMVIGFVSAGLMTLAQAVGVILGANIGTTVTAQITAFRLSAWAPLILFFGAALFLFVKKRRIFRHIGTILLGFGMLFVGVSLMKQTIAPLAEDPAFVAFVSALENPFLTILFSVAFTALLQSSSSSTVIFQPFAVQGILSYDTAVYLLIGAVIGSVTPNVLAGMTMDRAGKRCALMNVLVNLCHALVILILVTVLPGFPRWIQSLSPGDVGRQIANTHTIFAITAVLILLPLSGSLAKLSEKLLPMRADEMRFADERRLIYLAHTGAALPSVTLDMARQEIARMGCLALDNLVTAVEAFFQPTDERLALVAETEETVDYLDHAILEKLVELRTSAMSDRDRTRLSRLILTVADVERLSDHAENIAEYAVLRRDGTVHMSEEALADLRALADASLASVACCLDVFSGGTDRMADAADLEQRVDDLTEQTVSHSIVRLMNGVCEPRAGVVLTDMSIDLERVSDHGINIAEALKDL